MLSLFFPNLCLNCGRTLVQGEQHLCLVCLEGTKRPNLSSLTENDVAQKLWGRLPLNAGISLWLFAGGDDAQGIIHTLKYDNRPAACRSLGQVLGRRCKELSEPDVLWDAIAYVPMHPAKLRLRGYNQALLLAEGVAKELQLPIVHAIEKKMETPSQTRLGRLARWQNMRNAFGAARKPTEVAGKRILLVDDVLTTGATLEGAAQPLLQAGVRQIGIAVLASVV